jgi:hypothetical protein
MEEIKVIEGRNHKGETIQKIYTTDCPECHQYMVYFEFTFNMDSMAKTYEDKLIRLQQMEGFIDLVKRGEMMDFASIRFGCLKHYPQKKKGSYVDMNSSDVSKLNKTPISHIYLAQKLEGISA